MDKLLFTPLEAAKYLSLGRTKVYELITTGSLGSVRVGKCRRIPATALVDFVNRLYARATVTADRLAADAVGEVFRPSRDKRETVRQVASERDTVHGQ